MLEENNSFKPALNSKGLRQLYAGYSGCSNTLQASPEFKGIKTAASGVFAMVKSFKPALNSKGLRPCACSLPKHRRWLQASPEFKGIKTVEGSKGFCSTSMLQASPEFKGIKTYFHRNESPQNGFKPALNSKGLRLSARSAWTSR